MGEREVDIMQVKNATKFTVLAKVSHFFQTNAPWMATTIWLIFRAPEKFVLMICSLFLLKRGGFLEFLCPHSC